MRAASFLYISLPNPYNNRKENITMTRIMSAKAWLVALLLLLLWMTAFYIGFKLGYKDGANNTTTITYSEEQKGNT